MSEDKKEVDVHDLKPSKDAKGGRHRHHKQSGGLNKPGRGGEDTAGRGRHPLP